MGTPSWTHTFGGLSGDVPASYIDDNFDEATQTAPHELTPQVPLAPTAAGEVGTSGFSATADHQHPPQSAAVTTVAGTTYALLSTDDGGVIETTNGSAVTVELPDTLPAGWSCLICQAGGGQVTLDPTGGSTLNQADALASTRAQWSQISLRVRANAGSAADYVASGDMG